MSTRAGTSDGGFWGDIDDEVALQRYQTLVNTIDDGVYQLDSDGHFVAANDVIVEATGYSRDELLGEHVSLVLADSDVERIEREIVSRIETEDEDIATFEFGVQTADGDAVPCELRINLLIEEGEFRGSIGVVRDVSEEKQRMATLESAQASYGSITSVLDEANIGVFVLDDAFEVAWADETIEQYFGLDRDALIGRDKRQVVNELVAETVDDPDGFAETVLATYDDNSYIEEFEFRVTAGDDREERWLEHRSKPIESGEYAGGRIELYYDITDRKRSEDARRETEERFQSLVDAVEEDAIFRLDPAGHVVSWNEGATEIKGYDAEEILGEHVSTFYTEDDRAAGVPERNLERATEAGSIEDEGWRVRKDGTRFWANVTITAVRDEDGSPRGYLKITRDMTEHHERERELENELQQVFGRISDAFYAVDEGYRFTHVNERAEQLLQHSEEELLGENLWEAFPTIDRMDDVRDAFETAMNSQESTSLEFYNDNLEFWVEANLYPSETGISVYFRDVSKRKERERELERYEKTIETIWDGVTTLDADDQFVMVNEAFCEMTGYERDELLGEHVTLVHDETVNEEARELNEDVLADEQEYASLEFDLETADGDTIPAEGRFGPYELEDGSVGRTGVTRDITERKGREQAIRESERRYRTLVENFPNGIVTLFDEELRYTLAEGQAFDYLPHSTDDVEGHHLHEVWADDVVETIEPAFQAALEGEKQSVEGKSEGREWILHVVPLADRDGEVHGGMTMALDITDRKERERELAKYETIVETVNDGIYTVDEDGRFTMVNDAYTELTGYSREELLGSHVSLVVDESTIERARALEESITEGSIDEPVMEATLRTADGGHVPAEATFSLLPGDETERIGVARDITERKERERALEESEARFRMLAENLEEMVWIESADTRELLYLNPASERIWGRDREWLYDNPAAFLETIHPDDRQRVVQAYEAVPNEGFDEEYRIVRPDDEVRWLDVQAVPVRNEERQIRRVVGIVNDITDRKNHQRALEESERRYRTLVEYFPDGAVGLFDENLEYTAVGGRLLDEVGVDKGERVGNSVYEIYPDSLVEEVEQYFEAAIEGESNSFEVEFHDRNLYAHTLPVGNVEDEIFGGMLVVQDVTERREYERQLEEYRRWTQTLIENYPNGAVALVDEDLHYVTFGGTPEGDTSVSRDELEGAPVGDALPQKIADVVVPHYEAALDGESSEFEDTIDDSVYQFHFVPVRDDDGDVFAATAMSQDITERKERERALEESELRYRTLVEHFPSGAVGLYDETLTYTAVGGELLDGLGRSPDEVVDTTIYARYPDDLVDEIKPNFQAVFDGESNTFDIDLGDRDLQAHTLPVRNADDEIYAGMLVVQDVTERREYQRQLEESNERLEQFAYAASHDLQEPLRMVTSYLQLIDSRYGDALDEDGEEFLEFAVDGAERMRKMIDGLLEYSRVDTRGDPFEPVDLTAVLEDVREDLQMQIDESTAEITIDDLPRVDGDASQLRQLFQNLLSNAIEYSGDEPPRIDICAERDGANWIVSVRDEGVGIDPAETDRIFEVFQRLHTHEEHPGTGIGLALCRRIVERHGGEIWVESEPDDGSTFLFTLPVTSEQDA